MADTRSPLKDSPLRLPGQSVEEQREKLIEDVFGQWAMVAVFMATLAMFEWYRWYMDMKPTPVPFTIAAVFAALIAWWRVRRVIPVLKNLRLAREGERAVGQFLERLRESGHQVFHDVIGEGFNVDHVVIGPSGVYTVETKTWSKPLTGSPQIVFDGECIKVGGRQPDRDPVTQARAQADWIKKLLRESAGKQPFVRPVVVFPGWYVTRAAAAAKDVWVLEPKAFPAFLEKEPARLSPEDVRLFAFHLSRAIRTEEAARSR